MTMMARRQTTFSEQLREAIRQEERSRYRISLETGIAQGQLSRFMQGKCGLSLRSIDLLCECLGLGITARNQKGR